MMFTMQVLVEELKNLLEKSPPPAFDKTDDAGRTVLHLALLHGMPEQFILVLVQHMQKSELDLEDSKRSRAVDYLLDWEDVSGKVLQTLIVQGVNLSEKRKCSVFKHPLLRLCRRTVDGCQLLKLVGPLSVSQDFKNKMLEEAVKRGSSSTVEYLLETGAVARPTSYLLHDAAEANHDSLDKVRLLTDNGNLHPSQVNAKGLTLLHVAAGGKPPKIDLLVLALREGADPNKQDRNGDTALHKLAKNYSERTIPWEESEQAMEMLLGHPDILPNIQNSQGLTPLRILTSSGSAVPDRLLWMFLQSGADFRGGGYERALAAISRRPDGHVIISRLIRFVGVDGLQDYAKYMLEAAVEDGSGASVKVLLENKMYAAADGTKPHGRLLMIAARSNTEADFKLRCLCENGADCEYRDAKGFSVLHAVAQSETATEEILRTCALHAVAQSETATEEILRTCTSTLPPLRLDLEDKYGNTPLHIAAKSTHSCSDLLFEKLSDGQGNPNALNYCMESPLGLVLRYNHSNKELRRNKVALLLMNGCIPTKRDFEAYKGDADDFKNLFLSKDAIIKIQEPIQVYLFFARYCKKWVEDEKTKLYQTLAWTQSFQWTNMDAYEIENAAVNMIDEAGIVGWEMTNDEFEEVREKLKWNKFLANKNVGKVLERKFFGCANISSGERRRNPLEPGSWRTFYLLPRLVSAFLLQCLLLPFWMMSCPHTNCNRCKRARAWMPDIDPRRLPIVTFYSSMATYMAFLGLLIAHVVEDSPHHLSWFDWIVLLYVIAMVAEEIYQIKNQRSRYVSFTNGCDVAMILFFIVFFILRLVGNATDSLSMCRASEHVFAVAAGLSFLRLLYYMQVNHKLGPILFSFTAICAEVVSFMAILGVVLFAFGIAVTVVYNAGVYTVEFQNGSISVPHLVRGVWPTLQTMYWSLYGQVHYQDLDNGHDVLRPETIFGLILFAVWCLVSIIVLLNMLIALIDEAFDKVKKQNADFVWNLAIYNITKDIEELPSFPLPLNLYYFTLVLLKCCFEGECCSCKQMNTFGERRASPGATVVHKPKPKKKITVPKSVEALQLQGDGMRPNPDSAGALELQMQESSLNTELSRVIKVLSYQTKQRLSKQTKRVRACLRLLRSHSNTTDGQSGGQGNDNSVLEIGSDSDTDSDTDSDSDSENKEQPQVRYERISYDESHLTSIFYQGNGDTGKVGSCQFLNKPVSREFQYFEVTVADYGKNGSVGIGLAHRSYPLDRMPGLSKGSVAYHCGSGKLFLEHGRGPMTSPAQQGDIIGCGIESYATSDDIEGSPIVFFTRNGEELGRKKMRLPKSGFFPIIGLCSEGEKVEVDWKAKWKPPEDVEDEDQPSSDSSQSDGSVSPDCLQDAESQEMVRADEEIESNSYTTRLTPDSQTLDPTSRRSQLISAIGNNLFKYDSDELSGVGVYQSLVRPMSPEFAYYEVIVKDYGRNGTITVGLARRNYPLNQHPGWMKGSIAWHCDDGGLYVEYGLPRATYGPAKTGDIVGCGIDFEECGGMLSSRQAGSSESEESHVNKVKVFFTLNGERIVEETIEEPEGGLFPSVGMQSPDEEVDINLLSFTSTVPAFIRQARTERVEIEGNFVSFVSNPNPCNEVGGIQLMEQSMAALVYFEVTIISVGEQSAIGIGIASKEYPLDCQPGWSDGSIAYHCIDGRLLWGNEKSEQFYSPSLAKDIIGCGIRLRNDQLHVFFTHNGREIGQKPFEGLQQTELYPTVCMHSRGEKVKINVNARWDESREEPIFSRWEGMEIDGNKAFYRRDEYNKAGAVRLSREISEKYSYFEIEVTSFGDEGSIGVGLAPYDYPLDCEPGWLPGSVGYHCDDGQLFEGKGEGKVVHKPGRKGDKLGCGVKFSEDKEDKVVVFFTHNEEEVCQSELRRPSRGGLLFPTIGMASRGEAIAAVKYARWDRSRGNAVPNLATDGRNDLRMELVA